MLFGLHASLNCTEVFLLVDSRVPNLADINGVPFKLRNIYYHSALTRILRCDSVNGTSLPSTYNKNDFRLSRLWCGFKSYLIWDVADHFGEHYERR